MILGGVAAAPAEFSRQRGTSGVRKYTCKRRRKRWVTVLFYPLFQCKLNFTECWCRAKWFVRGDYGFNFEALRAMVPEAFAPFVAPTGRLRALLMLILPVCIMEWNNLSRVY